MSDKTTLDKIDEMLDWLDAHAEAFGMMDTGTRGVKLRTALKFIRPALEAAREQWIEMDRDETAAAEVCEPSNASGYGMADSFINPLYEAFMEARDEK